MNSMPYITIVTVVYNGVQTIENTIKSVVNQKYLNFEYIIIDGGSTDGTIDIIERYRDRINFFKSEPDNGIFDAMNKGLVLAKGEWISFMNSGDMFYTLDILNEVFSKDNDLYHMIYGNVCLYDKNDNYFFKSKTNKIKINLNAICHQSVFIKVKSHPLFSLDYKLSADHDLIYKLVKKKRIRYIDLCISKILIGGVSSNLKRTRREKLRISMKNGNLIDVLFAILFYLYGMIKDLGKKIILKFFSVELFNKLRYLKNKIEEN